MSEIKIGLPGSQLPARDVARQAVAAEEAGFDSLWWADRLMGWLPEGPHELLDPFVVMGAVAMRTSKLLLGTAVADPLRRHPAQLAQTALSVQQVSGNRLLLGVGCGEAAGTLSYGIGYDRPVARLEDALRTMRALWRDGESVDLDAEFYPLRGGICGLARSTPQPPVWIAAHGPRTLRLTGTVADGWMPTAYGAARYAEQLAVIRAAEQTAGRLGAVTAGAFLWVVAAHSSERARALFRGNQLRALGLLLPQGALTRTPLQKGPWGDLVPTRTSVGELMAGIDPDEVADVIPHGTPEEIAKAAAQYVVAGAEHLVICDMSAASGMDNGLGQSSMQLHGRVRDEIRKLVG